MSAQWNLDVFAEVKDSWSFIMVTPINMPRVNITEAHDIWLTYPAIVFQTGYRIAGTEEDIATSLTESGIEEDTILQILSEALSLDNYQTDKAEIYQDELTSYNTWKREAVKSNIEEQGLKLSNIIGIVNPEILKNAKPPVKGRATTTTTKTPAKKSPGTGAGRGREVTSLASKIALVAEGKVLDISKLMPNGAGVVTINRPGRSKKYLSETLPLLSPDLEHFVLALDMLPGGRDQYADELQTAITFFSTPIPTSPAQKTVAKKSPGQTKMLPPRTNIQPQVRPIPVPIPKSPMQLSVLKANPIAQREKITPVTTFPSYTKGQYAKVQAAKALEEKATMTNPLIDDYVSLSEDDDEDEESGEGEDEEEVAIIPKGSQTGKIFPQPMAPSARFSPSPMMVPKAVIPVPRNSPVKTSPIPVPRGSPIVKPKVSPIPRIMPKNTQIISPKLSPKISPQETPELSPFIRISDDIPEVEVETPEPEIETPELSPFTMITPETEQI